MERETKNFSSLLTRGGQNPLFETARRLCLLIREAGGRALFVGGCVRDLMMGKSAKDIDLECYGLSPEKLLHTLGPCFPLNLVGMSFGVIKLRNLAIDVALPRRENKRGRGHRGFLVSFDPSLTLAEAAARRDFTVNAMLWDPLTEEFFDPWHGKEDLSHGILRHVSEHFSEDPLRVLRAMQFAARFRFSVAPETVALCRTISREDLPCERMAAEWDKLLLQGVEPSRGLRFLDECGWAGNFPGLGEALKTPGLYAVIDAAVSLRQGTPAEKRLFMLALLGSFFSTEALWGKFVQSIWKEKTLDRQLFSLVRHAKELLSLRSDAELRHLAVDAANPFLLRLLARALADDTGRRALSLNEERMQILGIADTPPVPLIRGRDLAFLGVPPGKKMGRMLKELFELQLDGGFSDKRGGVSRAAVLLSKDKSYPERHRRQ